MSLTRRALLLFLLSLACASQTGASQQSSLVGFWVTPGGNWVVEITTCGSGFCGQLVGLSRNHQPNALRMDSHNPNPSKRNRPLCGLLLMGSFRPSADDAGKWDDGWVYDPQNGETYSGRMWLDGPDLLKVRGYILIPLFGRSETFRRETGPINRCSAAPDG